MLLYSKKNLVIFATLILLLQLTKCQDDLPNQDEESEEDDSSSDETEEESNETTNRRRRSADFIEDSVPKSKEIAAPVNHGIPGLPDPATILKIAEILTTVGQEVLPVLVQGNSAVDFVTQRLDRDLKFIKNFKNEFDLFGNKLRKK